MLQKLTKFLGFYALGGIIIIFSIGFCSGFMQFDPPSQEGVFYVWSNSVFFSLFIWIILNVIQFFVKLSSKQN